MWGVAKEQGPILFTVQNDRCYDKEREKIHKYCRSAIGKAAVKKLCK